MSADLPVLWTPAQQAWLQAMGYSVLHEGALAAELEAAAAMAQVMEPPAVELSVAPVASRPAVPRQAPAAPRAPVAPRPAAVDTIDTSSDIAPRTETVRRPSVRLPDRLQIALLRASGCNPNDPETQALMDSWPLDTLRADPAAKRALWPVLRALRRKGRGA
ncbi:hypothetical protein IFT63_12035 [Stenotrophomonas sp. CFBP 13724]|uniref:hypothetical protein n=1 Tax=Stenotrophomonas sp. CFBP 13724 TaxID=2775298 RepID=UPI0005AF0FA2|nr:hypothetical protein SN15_18225 [Stenotrophomonas maltophilia]MBD8644316.1 hypothetical protein [Stenotrophomonas sp. CFBP 13724]